MHFEGSFPELQLGTRRIQRVIAQVEYSAKTTVFVCAVEHRAYWEHLLVGGMSDNWLTSIARFYLLHREDKIEALRSALCWYNKMLSSMKATFITGISTLMMDSSVKPPHNNKESPTFRQHLHKGGFITIVSSSKKINGSASPTILTPQNITSTPTSAIYAQRHTTMARPPLQPTLPNLPAPHAHHLDQTSMKTGPHYLTNRQKAGPI